MKKLELSRALLTSIIFCLALLAEVIIGDYNKLSADEIQSQRIMADTNRSGLAQSNSVCSGGNVSVGDLQNNLTHRGLISFDLDRLRRDDIAEIVSVELDLSDHHTAGNPFRDLGTLQVVVIDLISYGSDSACQSTYSMTGSIIYDRPGRPLRPIDVTDSFKNAYARRTKWFFLRLQFSRETDRDGSYDSVRFHNISSTVRYSAPLPPVTLESPPDGSIVRCLTPLPVLNWRNIPGVSSYYVQVSQSRDFPSSPTHEVFTNSCETGNLEDGKTYYWRVKRAGTEWRTTDSIWSFTVRVVPDMPWINTPPHGAQISRRRPTLIWSAVPYATSYDLELREGSTSGPVVFHVFPTTTSFACPHDLPINRRYVWMIKACNRNHECSGYATGWFKVILPAPGTRPSIPKQTPAEPPGPPSAPAKPPVR